MQAQTKRIYSIMYSERFENRATVKAGELVKAGRDRPRGADDRAGTAPHESAGDAPGVVLRASRDTAASCATSRSHQADQFLYFTGSTRADVVAAQVANVHHPQHPAFEDFGDVTLRGDKGTGYIRVDWFTPDGWRPGATAG